MKVLLVGGSRSGKSGLAQNIILKLAAGGPVVYWAAMEPVDEEDDIRIAKHLRDREGLGFITIERGRRLSEVSVAPEASVLFDSVTALLANEMFFDGTVDASAGERAANELTELGRRVKNLVCVSDDIFRDGGRYSETTELYRRSLALAVRSLAEEFDAAAEVVCGVPSFKKGALPE